MSDISVQSADGAVHQFPEGTDQSVIDKAMKSYSANMKVEEPMSAGGRFAEGVLDPVYGAKQAFTHLTGSPEDIAKGDKAIQEREADITRRGGVTGTDWARVGGRTAPALIAGAATMPAGGGMIAAGLGGAAAELLNPVTKGNYGEEKLQQGLMGAAFGAVGGAGVKALGTVVGPTVRESAKELMKQGITLTPGQIAGGILRRGEEAAKSFPILGSFIRGAEGRSVESFNRASINQALEPIGVKLPDTAKAGHEAISYARLRLDDAYDTLLPKMQLAMDTDLASDIANVRFLASEMPETQTKQFATILQNRVAKHFTDTGAISGERLKSVESELNALAREYRSSSDAAQRQLAHHLDDVRLAIRDALTRQNPDAAGELQKINSSYAMFTRLESAASRLAGSQGVFTPKDLLQSIKSADKSVRKGAFARGDALMQDFAEFADTVLPSKMPDSGTTERAVHLIVAGGAGAGAAMLSPKTVIGVGAGMLPYTEMGGRVINKMAQPGPTREMIGRGIRRSAPIAGAGMEPSGAQFLDTNDKAPGPRSDLGLDTTVAAASGERPPMEGARKAADGQYYIDDPDRPGRYLRVET